MAIQSLGAGSGLDLTSIINQISAANKSQITALDSSNTKLQSKISSAGKLQSAISNVNDILKKFNYNAGKIALGGIEAKGSDSSLTVSVSGSDSGVGTNDINVTQMASSHRIASDSTVADPTAIIGSGVLTINYGAISGEVFNSGTGKYTAGVYTSNQTFSINLTNSSLNDVKNKINESGAAKASIINDGTGYKLTIQSNESGSNGVLKMQVSGGNVNLENLLNYSIDGTQNFKQTQTAKNLIANVNGIDITQKSNEIKAIDGLTINVSKTGSFTVTTTTNTESVSKELEKFVTAWNSFNSSFRQETGFGQTTLQSNAQLSGESSIKNLYSNMRGKLFGTSFVTGATTNTFADIGIKIDAQGNASLDKSKLSSALSKDPEVVNKIFDSSKGNASNAISAIAEQNATTSQTGIQGLIKRLKDQSQNISTQKEKLNTRFTAEEKRLVAQFTSLDSLIAGLNKTSSFLSANFK